MRRNATRYNPKLRSPWNLNENMTLGRTFKIGERYNLNLRGEAFNAFNRVRWGGPGNSVNGTTFGKVTTTGNAPRTMQVALRFVF